MQGTWSPAAGPGLDNGNWKKMAKNCKMVIGSLQSVGATWSLTIGPSAVEKKRDSAGVCTNLQNLEVQSIGVSFERKRRPPTREKFWAKMRASGRKAFLINQSGQASALSEPPIFSKGGPRQLAL